MKQTIIFSISFALLCFGLCAGENLVRNGDFSKGEADNISFWTPQSWGPPTGKIVLDRTEAGGSAPALRIVNNDAKQHTFLVQSIRLEPNTDYRFSYFIKGKEIKGEKPFCGGAVYLLDQGTPLFSIGSGLYRHATGTFDWKRVEHVFRTKTLQNTSVALVFSLRNVTGSVWYDKILLEKVEKGKAPDAAVSLYPVVYQNQTWALCRDFPAPLLFRVNLDRKWMPENFLQLVLEVPAGVEYLGSGALLPARDARNQLVFESDRFEKTEIVRDGKPYRRYTLTLAPGFASKLGKVQSWENYNRIYLRASGEPRAAGNVYWKLRSRIKEFPEQSFALTVLPPLTFPERPCERFQLCLARLWHMNSPEGVADAYLKFWTALQKRPWISDPYYMSAFPKTEQRKIYDHFNYSTHLASSQSMPWMNSLYNAVAQNRFPGRFPKTVKADGTEIPVSVSPWYLIEDPENLIWGTLFEEYAEGIRKNPMIKAIAIDYEPGALTHCFSAESRKRFRDFAKLGAVPSTDEILVKYREIWLKFRVEEHRKIIRRLSQAIRRSLPGVQFWLISDPLQTGRQRVAEWCGVDVKASDPDIDLHQDMPYFTGLPFFETMKLNISELKKPCFPFIDPSEDMAMYYTRYTPDTVKQNILITAALGGYGIGFWPNDVFDGRYLEAIKEGYRIVADTEKMYARPILPAGSFEAKCRNVMKFDAVGENGETVSLSIPQLDRKLRILHHRDGGTDLLTVFNFSDQTPAVVELSIPGYSASPHVFAEELVDGKRITEQGKDLSAERIRNGFLADVPPNGSAVFRITGGKTPTPVPSNTKCVDQTDVRAKLDRMMARSSNHSRIRPYRGGTSAAYWGILPGSDKALLFLEQGGGRIGIAALDGGEIVSWQPEGAAGYDLLDHQGRGFLGRFLLNAPDQSGGPYPFELHAITASESEPALSLTYTVPDYANASTVKNPLTGLKIEERISLKEKGGKIILAYSFANPGKESMRFSFKVNNFPKIGGRFAGKESLCSLTEISCGELKYLPGVPRSERMFLKSADSAQELRKHLIYQRIPVEKVTPGAIVVKAGKGMTETLRITPDANTAGFYSWANSVEGYTVEPISEVLTLPPGKTITWTCQYELVR